MMPGMIMLWYGSIASIPSGWTLCNGANGTPNLQGKFVTGAAPSVYTPGTTGGSASHNHDFTGDGHNHSLPLGTSVCNSGVPNYFDHNTDSSPATGTTDGKDGRPPFHCLCYIMKTPIP